MLVTWKYRPRGSVIEKIDPRARWITSFLVLFALTQFWDIRFLLFFLVIVLVQYALARLTWAETRRAWLFILIFVVGIVALNTVLTGRGGDGRGPAKRARPLADRMAHFGAQYPPHDNG